MPKRIGMIGHALLVAIVLLLAFNIVHAQVSGTVFSDYNRSGTRTTTNPNEPLAGGIIVTAYNSAGTILASYTTTSASAPNFSIPASGTAYNGTPGSNTGFVASGTAVRIEFTSLPSGNYPGIIGITNSTSVQFVTAGAGVTANFAINNPGDYYTANPLLVTPCYINGSQTSSTLTVLAGLNYDESGGEQSIAKPNQIGSTWGIAYKPDTKTIYAATVLKRNAGFGKGADNTANTADDIGAIYIFDNYAGTGAGTVTTVINMNSFAGVDVGSNPRLGTSPANDLGVETSPNHDYGVYGNEGKIGIGDIDISEDGQTLYVLNMNTKQLVLLNISNPTSPTLIGAYTIPTPTGSPAGDSFRPWGIGVDNGKVYVGGVSTADVSQVASNLRAYVLLFNSMAGTFSTVDIDGTSATKDYIQLDYNRTSEYFGGLWYPAEWRPWSDVISSTFTSTTASTSYPKPQPILSDIDFTENGSMILCLTDRNGLQVGHNNYSPTSSDNTLYTIISAGDLRQVCNTGNLVNPSYAPEGATGCSQGITPHPNSDNNGTPGTRYFNTVSYASSASEGHGEIPFGGMATNKGTNSMVITALNPEDFYDNGANIYWSGGLRWFNTNTGATLRNFTLYNSGSSSVTTFAKGVGLGDIELLTASTPTAIEIGNRVWLDTDKDGVQDAGESGIGNVTMELYADFDMNGLPDGTALATTTTLNASTIGTWYFNSSNVVDGDPTVAGNQFGPQAGKRYLVRVGAADWTGGAGAGDLANRKLTLANIGGAGQPDALDNDASMVASIPQISVMAGGVAQNDHSLDMGFYTCNLATTGLGTPTCYNNGTPSGADDRISFTLNPTGTGLDTYYNVTVSGGATVTPASAAYGSATTFLLQGGSANGSSSYTITITDASALCSTAAVVGPVAACGFTCPGNQPLCPGETYTITANTGFTNYTFFKDNIAVQGPSASTTYVASTAGSYTWTATNGSGCSVTGCCPIVLEAIAPTPGSVSPTPQTVCSGGNPSLLTLGGAAATAGGTLSYQWQSSTTSCAAGFADIVSATANTYDPPSGLTQTTYYRVIVTNTVGASTCTATSGCATVMVNSIVASTIAGDHAVCSGADPVAFTVTTPATGAGTLSYQWQSSTTSCAAGFSNIALATSATYDAPSGLAATTYYRVVVTSTLNGVACTANSNCVTVTVNPYPDFNLALATACPGDNPEVTIGSLTGGTPASSTMKINTGAFMPYVASPPNLTTAQGITINATNTVTVRNEHGCETAKNIAVPAVVPLACPPVNLTKLPAGFD